MGTHNQLLRIATVNYPRAYLEIIAIAPDRPAPVPARAARWFDMDDPRLAGRIARSGPCLAHFVANVAPVAQACSALAALGIDRGPALAASRMTPRGLLEWQITVRDDGQRLFDGALPTLIQWGDTHPIGGLPESGLTLQSLSVTHPQHEALARAYEAIGLQGVAVQHGPANLIARLGTPRGIVTIESKGL